MARGCPEGQYRDALLKKCFLCTLDCQKPLVNSKCTIFCVSAQCRRRPGHYYDGLLKTCVKCSDVCGRHPADCSQHCRTLPATTKRMLVKSTTRDSRGFTFPATLNDPAVLLYSALIVSLVLLLTSLSLALVVFMRRKRSQPPKPGRRERKHNLGQGVREQDIYAKSSHPSADPSPTETCVCVHCFPDLSAPAHQRPHRPNFHQRVLLQPADLRGPMWTQQNMRTENTAALEEQKEAAVG